MTRIAIARRMQPRISVATKVRLGWLAVGLSCAMVLGVARHLSPDARGYGTHEGLGMPPCGFVLVSGWPCPTCGMTTSFALMMHFHPLSAFVTQPAGAVLCLATIIACIGSTYLAVSGRPLNLRFDAIGEVRFLIMFGALILTGWIFKMAYGLATGVLPIR